MPVFKSIIKLFPKVSYVDYSVYSTLECYICVTGISLSKYINQEIFSSTNDQIQSNIKRYSKKQNWNGGVEQQEADDVIGSLLCQQVAIKWKT
ncbi:hypothetical protein T10_8712 [Trichinella papuae]|uniref:Uncharacterized protein n=1 Tax=Trichinella papuae TaxID=268474 RepID=A0A0V1MMH5_9BILA|nr:hypothetical protein T10_8712 [Trichinella papuae]